MKPKTLNVARGRPGKGKTGKKELPNEDFLSSVYKIPANVKPSVEIIKCISYQKFRYSGENRPGKKYQEKDFMELKLSHLQEKVVRVVIICTDADNRELIHPNGLVGKDCHDGIYDKECAITRDNFTIKIPYLRTERIKTKKNEHENIRNVLSDRALHLPSPYKERCLSQCTDKYTSCRKFDTTKVCFGVIVTVQSHQGILNGSLHAISHVVRNASEKTTLSILKLSDDVIPALTGASVDIFTSEDGPAIEADKYLVSVSCKLDEQGSEWVSSRYSLDKNDILYKRVISYRIPRFEPDPQLTSEIIATLHLECPQSNQYTEYKFTYMPQQEIVVVDEETFNEHKGTFMDQDIKLSAKRMRMDYSESDGSSEAIKANLKTKIQARQEIPGGVETVYVDSQSDALGGISHHYIISGRQQHQPAHVETYSRGGQPVLIRHKDPQTGEASVLLDMDASKSNSSSDEHTYGGEREAEQFALQLRERKRKGSTLPPHSQGVEVIAAGYSDDVPPNTTVYIYTKNEQNVAINSSDMIIQEVTDDDPVQVSCSPSAKREKDAENTHSFAVQNGRSEQIIRREPVAEKVAPYFHNSELSTPDNERILGNSCSEEAINASDMRYPASRTSLSASDINVSTSTGSTIAQRYTSVTSSPSSFNYMRFIANKPHHSSSPWAVETSREDVENDYATVFKGFLHDSYGKKIVASPLIKREVTEEEPLVQRSIFNQSSSMFHSYQNPEKLFHGTASEVGSNLVNVSQAEMTLTRTMTSNQADVVSSNTVEFEALPMNIAAAEIVANVPTEDIFKIAEHLNGGLHSSTSKEASTVVTSHEN